MEGESSQTVTRAAKPGAAAPPPPADVPPTDLEAVSGEDTEIEEEDEEDEEEEAGTNTVDVIQTEEGESAAAAPAGTEKKRRRRVQHQRRSLLKARCKDKDVVVNAWRYRVNTLLDTYTWADEARHMVTEVLELACTTILDKAHSIHTGTLRSMHPRERGNITSNLLALACLYLRIQSPDRAAAVDTLLPPDLEASVVTKSAKQLAALNSKQRAQYDAKPKLAPLLTVYIRMSVVRQRLKSRFSDNGVGKPAQYYLAAVLDHFAGVLIEGAVEETLRKKKGDGSAKRSLVTVEDVQLAIVQVPELVTLTHNLLTTTLHFPLSEPLPQGITRILARDRTRVMETSYGPLNRHATYCLQNAGLAIEELFPAKQLHPPAPLHALEPPKKRSKKAAPPPLPLTEA
jgi:histone H3/H4